MSITDFSSNDGGVKYTLPKNIKKYIGEYIAFFPNNDTPKVLFSSINPEEVYDEAIKISKKLKRTPTVVKIDTKDNPSHLMFHGI